LNDFSFEELNVSQATQLKNSFEFFKVQLEQQIFQQTDASANSDKSKEDDASNLLVDRNSTSPDASLLVAQVSHEIRTPLNGIIGFTDLLKEDELTNIQLERVNAIQKASYSLMEIINELLEYSKLSAGLEKFESIDFNLNNLVNDVMYLCKTLLNNKKIKLEAHIDEAVPAVLLGDPSKLTQVLLNILGNATKFVEEGSIRLGIRLISKQNSVYSIEFVIEDTGIGISEENLKNIFNSFQQAEKTTYVQYGGTGLGLSIVKQIIEKLDGEIQVKSKLGVGTTFQFVLPYAKGNLKNLKKSEQISKVNARTAVKGLRVLVFEDNTLNQKLIEQRLKSWNCTVHITDNARYGLAILDNHEINVVLMDLKMPNMNGFEITALIRQHKSKHIREIPVIAVSADFSIHDRAKCTKYQIDDFILKPYMAEELLEKLLENTKYMKNISTKSPKLINPYNPVITDATKINLSVILEECMGKTDLLEELVILYKENTLEFIGVLSANLPDGDMNLVAAAAHKIKSGLAMMQSESLHSIVVQIEEIIKTNGNPKQLTLLFDCFIEEYPLVEKAIDEQVKALKKGQ